MITAALILVAALYASGLIALAIAWHKAPEGFEDESGFHFGAEKNPLPPRQRRGFRFKLRPESRHSGHTSADWHTA